VSPNLAENQCRRHPALVLVFGCLLGSSILSTVQPAPAAAAVHLLSRSIEPDRRPEAVLTELAAAAGRHTVLVLDRERREAGRRALAGLGVVFHQYLPDDAFTVTLPGDLATESASASIAGVVRLAPEDKVHPSLLARGIDDWAIAPDGSALLNVRVHPDVTDIDARGRLAALGAEVLEALLPHHRYTVSVDADRLLAIAGDDLVAFVDEVAPPIELENDGSREVVRANQAQAPPYNLSGNDIDVAVIDGGRIDPDHPDFTGRLIVVDNVSTSSHATHVAGTMGGGGVNSVNHGGTPEQWRGMAPATRIYSYRSSNHLTKYNGIINTYNVEITTNSWGNGVNSSNCDIYGDYRFDAPDLDQIITGLHGRRINITFSGGNERNDCDCGMSCDPPYINFAVVNPPKPAKNLIVVGAINSDDLSMTTFSSWGPVDDGRIKPEVVAAGDEVGGDGGIKSCNPGGGYGTSIGTSMAAPAATGSSALIMEHFRHVIGQHPWPSTVRGLLMHSALDRFNPGPDYRSGYGQIDLIAAVGAIDERLIREEQLTQDDLIELPIDVAPETGSLKVTIAWDDPAGADGAAIALVNDLDLELIDPSNGSHLPWLLDPADPDAPATTGTDRRNNVEQVFVDAPESGQWMARIRGFNVPEGPQPVSIFGIPEPQSQWVAGSGTSSAAPARLALRVEPNPIASRSGGATLRFQVPTAGPARVRILDASGRLVRLLLDDALPAGQQAVTWDGRNADGSRLASGVYLVEVETAGGRASHKLVLAP
jgi:hypothetical protein